MPPNTALNSNRPEPRMRFLYGPHSRTQLTRAAPALVLLASLFTPSSPAQTACPMGVSPGDPRCGPSPQYGAPAPNRPLPARRWVNQWGAIAADDKMTTLGSSTGMSSRRKAERDALAKCKARSGRNCEVLEAYGNGCVAVSVGTGQTFWNIAGDRNNAEAAALSSCRSRTDQCRIYQSECSLPALR